MTTWTIENLDRNLIDGGVFSIHWKATKEETEGENTFSATAYGNLRVTPQPSSSSFISYDSLTQETVMGWVHEEVNRDDIEANLSKDIAEKKTPVVATGTPW